VDGARKIAGTLSNAINMLLEPSSNQTTPSLGNHGYWLEDGRHGAAMSNAAFSLAALASLLFSQVPDLSPTSQHQ